MCVYFCGGSCIEDVTTHLMKHLSLHPTLRTCSADTILRAIEELTIETEKHDAKRTYKKFLGYGPGIAVIGDMLVCFQVYIRTGEMDKDITPTSTEYLHGE